MEANKVTLWVYADNEQDIQTLQHELDSFVINKYNQGILIKANTIKAVLQKYGNSAIVNAVLKQ